MTDDLDVEAASGTSNQPQLSVGYISSLLRWTRLKRDSFKEDVFSTWYYHGEDRYRPGYPLFSSFLGQYPEMQSFRRFGTVRMRLVLAQQDKITLLEQELSEIDKSEDRELWLGSMRRDKNGRRTDVLGQMNQELKLYDDMVQRAGWAFSTPHAENRHLNVTKRWLASTGCIARTERSYLESGERNDLMNIGYRDLRKTRFDVAVERWIEGLYVLAQRMSSKPEHREGRIIQLSYRRLKAFTRAVLAACTVIILLVPIILLNSIHGTKAKFAIIFPASTIFVSVLTLGTATRTTEIFAAGAAYAAVMVVFVSGNGVTGP